MVSVVIDNPEFLVAVAEFETAFCPAEGCEGRGNRLERDAQFRGKGDHQHGIVGVVNTRNTERHVAEEFLPTQDGEPGHQIAMFESRLEPFKTITAMLARSDRNGTLMGGADTRGTRIV